MDTVMSFIQTLLSNIDLGSLSFGLVIGALLLAAITTWTPNYVAYNFFHKLGQKKTAWGRKMIGRDVWEKLEKGIIGTVRHAYQGLVEGLESDNADQDEKAADN